MCWIATAPTPCAGTCSPPPARARRVPEHLEESAPTSAGRAIQSFVEDLSNWYVRRSRRRFWKTENDADKLAAYHTLYECLVTLCKLMAPVTPVGAARGAQRLMDDMQLVMRVVSLGRAARSKAAIKVRQPLSRVTAFVATTAHAEGLRRQAGQGLGELNVKGLAGFPPGA